MMHRERVQTFFGILLFISMATMSGCGGSSDDQAENSSPDLKAEGKADPQAWSLGNKLSLAAVGYAEQAAQGAVDNVMAEAGKIASELGTEVGPLPARSGNRAQDAAAVLNYLLKTTGPAITRSLENQHGRRPSLLFQILLKTNLLLLLYAPSPNNAESRALVDFLSEKATETSLPTKLWSPLVNQVRSGAPYNQVKMGVRQFQNAVLAHLSNTYESGAQASNQQTAGTSPAAKSPLAVIPAPPSPPKPLTAGEQYLRQLQPTSVVSLPEGREHHFDREFEVQKVSFENGVYFCPPTERSTGRATFELGQGYTRLKGGVAISDHRFQKAWSPVTFRIVGDGNVIWTSRPLQMCGDWEAFDVDLIGINQMTLEVECTGPHTGAHGAWMDPVLLKTQP